MYIYIYLPCGYGGICCDCIGAVLGDFDPLIAVRSSSLPLVTPPTAALVASSTTSGAT